MRNAMTHLNSIISQSKSFQTGTEGRGVIVFKAEGKLVSILKSLNFRQHSYTDYRTGLRVATNQWFNSETKESIFVGYKNPKTWTYALNGNILCLVDGKEVLQ